MFHCLSFPALTPQDKKFFADSLNYFSFVPLHYEIALLAADIKQKYGLKLADSVVAATAIFIKTTLVTRNIKDFKKVPNLSLQKI